MQNMLKTQYKLHFAKYSNFNMKFIHNTNVSRVTGFYEKLPISALGLPSHWENIRWLKPAQAHCPLQNYFASCLIFILYYETSHVSTPPMLGCLRQ